MSRIDPAQPSPEEREPLRIPLPPGASLTTVAALYSQHLRAHPEDAGRPYCIQNADRQWLKAATVSVDISRIPTFAVPVERWGPEHPSQLSRDYYRALDEQATPEQKHASRMSVAIGCAFMILAPATFFGVLVLYGYALQLSGSTP